MSQLSIFRLAWILGTGALVAACADRPAPVTPAVAPPMPAAKQIYVVVERGQSLDRIAQIYRVAKQDIIAANQLKPPYELKPGTVLAMPAQPSKPSEPPRRATPGPDQRATAVPDAPRQTTPKRQPPKVIPLD